jgi:hypothetical protein
MHWNGNLQAMQGNLIQSKDLRCFQDALVSRFQDVNINSIFSALAQDNSAPLLTPLCKKSRTKRLIFHDFPPRSIETLTKIHFFYFFSLDKSRQSKSSDKIYFLPSDLAIDSTWEIEKSTCSSPVVALLRVSSWPFLGHGMKMHETYEANESYEAY